MGTIFATHTLHSLPTKTKEKYFIDSGYQLRPCSVYQSSVSDGQAGLLFLTRDVTRQLLPRLLVWSYQPPRLNLSSLSLTQQWENMSLLTN